MKKESASFKRAKRLEALVCIALERFSMEEIINAVYNAGDTQEFEKAVILVDDELISKDGSGNIVAIDMTDKGMNCWNKLRDFLKAEIFPYYNEQQNALFL